MDLLGVFFKKGSNCLIQISRELLCRRGDNGMFILSCSSEIPKNAVCSILAMDHKLIISFSRQILQIMFYIY